MLPKTILIFFILILFSFLKLMMMKRKNVMLTKKYLWNNRRRRSRPDCIHTILKRFSFLNNSQKKDKDNNLFDTIVIYFVKSTTFINNSLIWNKCFANVWTLCGILAFAFPALYLVRVITVSGVWIYIFRVSATLLLHRLLHSSYKMIIQL